MGGGGGAAWNRTGEHKVLRTEHEVLPQAEGSDPLGLSHSC